MSYLSISYFILASLYFQNALASLAKISARSQLLYRSAVEAKHQCQLNVKYYIRYGEEDFELYKTLSKLRTADDLIDETSVSCIANILCEQRAPSDIRQAMRVYSTASETCSQDGSVSKSVPNMPADSTAILDSGLIEDLDPGNVQTLDRNAVLLTFTTGNLIYLLGGFLLGTIVRTYVFPSGQIGELSKSPKLRRPEL
jgi:hypothetical protein